jgi:hypothetical protein
MKKILFIAILFLSSCHTTYYWYSNEAATTLSKFSPSYFTASGRIEKYNPVKTHPDGTLYTMMGYKKKDAKGYLWEDKRIVKKERTPKEEVKLNKRLKKLMK